MKATAVLLNYRRPQNIARVAKAMSVMPWVDEVIVWDNSPRKDFRLLDALWNESNARVLGQDTDNEYTYGRFLASMAASNDFIVTCDDDNVVRNWQQLWDCFHADPTRICAALGRGHLNGDGRNRFECDRTYHEVLLGWGAVFNRNWIEPSLRRYREQYGQDDLFHRKADRIFSFLMGCEHQVLLADFEQLPEASDETALWKRRDHYPLSRLARARCERIALGLGPLTKEQEG